MKITKARLKEIIQEEIERVAETSWADHGRPGLDKYRQVPTASKSLPPGIPYSQFRPAEWKEYAFTVGELASEGQELDPGVLAALVGWANENPEARPGDPLDNELFDVLQQATDEHKVFDV